MRLSPATLLSVLLASRAAAWTHVEDAEALEEAIQTNKQTLVAYILPNEENSAALEPEWLTLQTQHEQSTTTSILSIDCSLHRTLCRHHNITSFPSIRLHRPSNHPNPHHRYRGPRKASSITTFLHRAQRPPLSHVNSKNITTFQSVDDIVFIAHFAPVGTKALWNRFDALSRKYADRYSFAVSSGVRHPQRGGVLTCYNNPDGIGKETVDFGAVALEGFVKACSEALIPELGRGNELGFYESRKSLVHYFVKSNQEREAYVAEMRPLAKKYQEYLHFTTIDADEYADVATMLGAGRGAGGLSVQNPNTGDLYPYDQRRGKLTAQVLEMFLVDIIQGRVKPWNPRAGKTERDEL